MAIVYDRVGLGDTAPNYVEPGNNPAPSPWTTNYADPAAAKPPGELVTLPKKKGKGAKKAAAVAQAKATGGKVKLQRHGTVGSVLDKLLPLMVDGAGKKTIFGLPPGAVYIAAGVLSTTLGVLIWRLITGGGGRRATVSNPKRRPTRRRALR